MIQVIKYFDLVEGEVCLRINRLSHRLWVRSFFSAVSRLGDGGFWVLMGAVLIALQGPQAIPVALHIDITAGTRMILGLHYPSDVVVGGAIGAILARSSLMLA